jgi:hypothetical protein
MTGVFGYRLPQYFVWVEEPFLLATKCVVNDVRQTEIHTPEPLAPELSSFEVEVAIAELRRHKYIKI